MLSLNKTAIMELLCYYFALLHLLLFVLSNPEPANGQGLSLELNGNSVENFDLLLHSDIDDSDAVEDVGGNLVCRTNLTTCCRAAEGMARGNWYYPTGAVALFGHQGTLPSGQIYRMRRYSQVVRLRRELESNATANGIYRCEVTDQNDVTQTRYVGLYTEGAGVVSISEGPQFSLISADPLEFTLTSTTTGGPPTTAQWTQHAQPGGTVITAGDGFTQTLLNATTATFEHTLTVTGITGVFMFSTTNNAITGAPVTSSITVQAANPPTGLMAVQDGPTSILVSWTAPASGGASVTGYHISYQTGDSEESVTVGDAATNSTLTGLQSGATYSISIVALSSTLPSTVVGPVMVNLKAFEAPTVMTSVLSPTSIRVTFTQPSGSLDAESYDIQYTRVTGAEQTLCGSVGGTGNTTNVTDPVTITSLEEFSSYNITVTAYAFSAMRATTEKAMTLHSAPAAAPRDLVSTTVLSTSITVGWNTVVCVERNGVIDNYIVRFGPGGGVQSEQTVGTTRTHSVSGLSPSTRYRFRVAAVNSAGTGPFTATLIVETNALSPPTDLMAVQDSLTSILVSWTVPASDSSVITGYNITYTSTGGSDPQSVTTGYSTANHTLSSLESGATYGITIVSLVGTSSSSVEGPVTVTVQAFEAPAVTAQVESPTSIRVTFTQPSGLPAESYDIQYARVIGAGQTLCDSVEDTGTTTTMQSPFTITNLEEFSSYDITVTARVFSASTRATTEQTIMTSPAVPAAAPRDLVSTVECDTIKCLLD